MQKHVAIIYLHIFFYIFTGFTFIVFWVTSNKRQICRLGTYG